MNGHLIENGSWVHLRYEQQITARDGSVEEAEGAREVRFVFGIERQYLSLEKALTGKKAGDRITVPLSADELFGSYDSSLVREIPQEGLKRRRLHKDRRYIELKQGALVSFFVRELRENTVVADFNHPNAGATARADITILDVRPANGDELAEAMERMGCRS